MFYFKKQVKKDPFMENQRNNKQVGINHGCNYGKDTMTQGNLLLGIKFNIKKQRVFEEKWAECKN